MSRGFSRTALAVFDLAFLPWMRSRIRKVLVTGLPRGLPAERPLILASNHSSWWDPFALREVQRALRPGAPIHSVMLSAELARRPFLRRIGAIGIDPASATSISGAVRELQTRAAERPDSIVIFFPQGRIRPSFVRPLGFQPGIEMLARRLGAEVLPMGLHLEPLASPASSIFLSAGEPIPGDEVTAGAVEAAVERELDAIRGFLAHHGEGAPDAWPGPWGRIAG